jgi:hypothetical protein
MRAENKCGYLVVLSAIVVIRVRATIFFKRGDMRKLVWLQQFLPGKVLADITRDQITAIGAGKMAEASGPTANRYLALVRSISRRACFEWEWIDKVPKVNMYRESKRRVRWITPGGDRCPAARHKYGTR